MIKFFDKPQKRHLSEDERVEKIAELRLSMSINQEFFSPLKGTIVKVRDLRAD